MLCIVRGHFVNGLLHFGGSKFAHAAVMIKNTEEYRSSSNLSNNIVHGQSVKQHFCHVEKLCLFSWLAFMKYYFKG